MFAARINHFINPPLIAWLPTDTLLWFLLCLNRGFNARLFLCLPFLSIAATASWNWCYSFCAATTLSASRSFVAACGRALAEGSVCGVKKKEIRVVVANIKKAQRHSKINTAKCVCCNNNNYGSCNKTWLPIKWEKVCMQRKNMLADALNLKCWANGERQRKFFVYKALLENRS